MDTGWLPGDIELHAGVGVFGYATAAAGDAGIEATPVVRLHDEIPRTWRRRSRRCYTGLAAALPRSTSCSIWRRSTVTSRCVRAHD
jgi:hypothetical protein